MSDIVLMSHISLSLSRPSTSFDKCFIGPFLLTEIDIGSSFVTHDPCDPSKMVTHLTHIPLTHFYVCMYGNGYVTTSCKIVSIMVIKASYGFIELHVFCGRNFL